MPDHERITNDYDHTTTAAEVAEGVDLSGKAVVVTGAASGIGIETARAMAGTGASVTLAVRDLQRGEEVRADISETTANSRVNVRELDLTDIGSVDRFIAEWEGALHVLVNNAGVMASPETYLDNGWELQFATNHLGHFALATGLHNALAADGAARVVSVSSSGHGVSPVVFDDLFFEEREYQPMAAYGQSKTANVLFAVELTRRWAADGITANALMPGGIATNLQRYWSDEYREQQFRGAKESGVPIKTPEQGAATSVYLAVSDEVEGIGGRYFEDCGEAEVVESIRDGLYGVRAYALDADGAERLWDVSLELLEAERG